VLLLLLLLQYVLQDTTTLPVSQVVHRTFR